MMDIDRLILDSPASSSTTSIRSDLTSSPGSSLGKHESSFPHDEYYVDADKFVCKWSTDQNAQRIQATEFENTAFVRSLHLYMLEQLSSECHLCPHYQKQHDVQNRACSNNHSNNPRVDYYATPDVFRSEKVLVIVASGRGDQCVPGIWSRSLFIQEGLGAGSMLNYCQTAMACGYELLLLNEPSLSYDRLERVWTHSIFAFAAHKIDFLAFGHVGQYIMNLVVRHPQDTRARVGRIGLIESSRLKWPRGARRDPAAYDFLSQCCVNWERSDRFSFGQEIPQIRVTSHYKPAILHLSAGPYHHPREETTTNGSTTSKPQERPQQSSNVAQTIQLVMEAMFRFFAHKSNTAFDFSRSEVRRSRTCEQRMMHSPKILGLTKTDSRLSIDDFELLKVIGRGAFGKVMLVRKKSGPGANQVFAMKVLRKAFIHERNQVEHTKTERAILKAMDHPFLVKLVFAFQNPSKLYLVMDYYSGGTLYFHHRKHKRFSGHLVRFLGAQIFLALAYLHSYDTIYRDLKLENILCDAQGFVALTDFGLSRENVRGDAETFCGTAEYIAPELLVGTPYGRAVDWWSFGILLFELLVGHTPFYHPSRKDNFKAILHSPLSFPSHIYVSLEAKSLIKGLLQRKVCCRLGSGSRGAVEIMDHAFFAGFEWESLLRKNTTSPFEPYVSGLKNKSKRLVKKTDFCTDTSNVSTKYTQEVAQDSVSGPTILSSAERNAFADFSYIDEDQFFLPMVSPT